MGNSRDLRKFTHGKLYNDNFSLLHSLFLQLQTQQHVHTTITIYFIRNNKLINNIFIFPQFINHLWMFAFRGDNKKQWWWRHLKYSIGLFDCLGRQCDYQYSMCDRLDIVSG